MREGQFLFHGLPRDSASAAVMAIAETRQRWSCHTDLFYEYMPYLFNGSVTCPLTLKKVCQHKWQSIVSGHLGPVGPIKTKSFIIS